jgi:dihydroxy-acid dehydratase
LIVIDAELKQINVDVTVDDMAARRASWRRPASSVQRGVLAKYRAEVSSASEGAVTIPPLWDK